MNNNENGKMLELMHYCVFMHWEILIFLHESTDAYTTRQGNVYNVYYNVVVTVAISNRCLASTASGECSLDQKGGPGDV